MNQGPCPPLRSDFVENITALKELEVCVGCVKPAAMECVCVCVGMG